jgi:hypothetical protein
MSEASSLPPTSATPSRRPRPTSLRLDQIGIQPTDIIGKVIKCVRKSTAHPALTIAFVDDSSVQIRVDGYDPQHPGVPKELEMDSCLQDLLFREEPVELPVLDCAFVTLSDKAFQRQESVGRGVSVQSWDQKHLGLALKLPINQSVEGKARWHCIWASMEENNEREGVCTFRSYEDVYLAGLSTRTPPSTPTRHRRRKSRAY